MTKTPMHQILRGIFDVVVAEAERNPRLAQELARAMAEPPAAERGVAGSGQRKPLDWSQFHAVNILRLHGESALRGKLDQVRTVADLKAVARASGLVLAQAASKARASRTELITAIIAAAKHYDAQRTAANA